MTEIIIYHNPRCSKSRQSLQLLEDKGITPKVVEYLNTPPSTDELTQILKLLGLTARELIRSNEAEYKALGLDNEQLSEQELVAAMVHAPKLMQRPIIVAGDKAVIGRPPENILTIL